MAAPSKETSLYLRLKGSGSVDHTEGIPQPHSLRLRHGHPSRSFGPLLGWARRASPRHRFEPHGEKRAPRASRTMAGYFAQRAHLFRWVLVLAVRLFSLDALGFVGPAVPSLRHFQHYFS